MSSEVNTDADRAAAKRYTFLGVGLICLAFVGPLVATGFGLGTAESAGADTSRTLGALLVLAFISWLATHKRSDLAKAKGRTVVGLLLCLTVGNNIANVAREQEQAKEFLRQAIALQAKQQSKFEELGRRFDQVTVNQYLTPSALVRPASVDAGKAALERYRALLSERNNLLRAALAEHAAFVHSIPPGTMRAAAEKAMGPSQKAAEDIYRELDRTQSAHADAIAAVFEWATLNTGKVGARGEQWVFSTREQQAQLVGLATKLQKAEAEAVTSAQYAQAAMNNASAKRDASLKQAAELLSK